MNKTALILLLLILTPLKPLSPPISQAYKNSWVVVGSHSPGFQMDYQAASLLAEPLNGMIYSDSYVIDKIEYIQHPLIIVGGPLANAISNIYNPSLDIEFWFIKGIKHLRVGSHHYSANESEDLAVVTVFKGILFIEGCTRNGTYAACLYLLSNINTYSGEMVIIRWKDLNHDGKITVGEVFREGEITCKTGNYELIVLPDEAAKMFYYIDSAKISIKIEVYILTYDRIIDHLLDAHKRGVNVKVLLESTPYGAPYINGEAYYTLSSAGIEVKWAGTRGLDHAKFMIIDDTILLVGTANYAYSSFHSNREYIVVSKDPRVVGEALSVFFNDWNSKNDKLYCRYLLVSPYNSRARLSGMIMDANTRILLEIEYFTDNGLASLLISKVSSGVDVRVIIEDYEANSEIVDILTSHGVKVRYSGKLTMHAKMMIVDDKMLYVGSINFTPSSLEFNREVGIIVENEAVTTKASQFFWQDWNSGRK